MQNNLNILSENFGFASTEVKNTADSLQTTAKLIQRANDLIDFEYKERLMAQANVVKDEVDTRIVKTHITADGMKQRMYGVLGDSNAFDYSYNSANKDGISLTPLGAIIDSYDLSTPESELRQSFDDYLPSDTALLRLSDKERDNYYNSRA